MPSVKFTHDLEEGTGSGLIRKEFRGQRGTVRLELDGAVVTDPTQADDMLAELTGSRFRPTTPMTCTCAPRRRD